jgi:hypothetical protein
MVKSPKKSVLLGTEDIQREHVEFVLTKLWHIDEFYGTQFEHIFMRHFTPNVYMSMIDKHGFLVLDGKKFRTINRHPDKNIHDFYELQVSFRIPKARWSLFPVAMVNCPDIKSRNLSE